MRWFERSTPGAGAPEPVRTLVLRCADWPVLAAGALPEEPAVVLHANRVVAATPAARREGVVPGQRRREAQSLCPGVELHSSDPVRDARAFEEVAVVVGDFTPRIEITLPGEVAFPTLGPSRYFGGDEELGRRLAAAVDSILGERGWHGWAGVGVADGPFAAAMAARHPRARPVRVVPPGGSRAELAGLPVSVLGRPELGDLLVRLGVRTLGDLAALGAAEVSARFGEEGRWAHRVAAGADARVPDTVAPPPELTVHSVLEPPAERADTVAFVAKGLAEELDVRLAGEALWCTRVVVTAESEHGEVSERVWCHEGPLRAPAVAERVRWQLDGWLNGPVAHRPTGGVELLRLTPDELVPAQGRQLGFWGGSGDVDERVVRGVARLEGLLGEGAVTVPLWRGGRGPGERWERVPAGSVALTPDRPSAAPAPDDPPWPGQVPAPAPSTVLDPRPKVELLDALGVPVGVSGRGILSAEPVGFVVVEAGVRRAFDVVDRAGPWPSEERWWDDDAHRRRARLQVVLDDGTAHLLALERGTWHLEATYD